MENEEKTIQLFVGVNNKGEITEAQMGKTIVVTNPAFPYVFMIDDETAIDISRDRMAFRVEVIDFEPRLTQLYKPEPPKEVIIEKETDTEPI